MIWVFGASCVYAAPSVYGETDGNATLAAIVIALGTLPMVLVGTLTAPYVASIHVFPPELARRSKEALMKWVKSISSSTPMEITTIRVIGFQKRNTVDISNLKPLKTKFLRIANFELKNAPPARSAWDAWVKRTFKRHPQPQYFVGELETAVKRSRAPGVWKVVKEHIKAQSIRST
ncbi:hypothetical protein K402DRAFT_407518 [Aulographum hederae CBS 113979]|uniref:Uncharacterized protein n=1 Tax=Aulographum hederae CBS 113979 TaxID=1176131 RepID=A0A6G1GP32_9PEZI|nr:hypothetical protein K402DRAFT_407518 [Aulographum hederae CBS 113979]